MPTTSKKTYGLRQCTWCKSDFEAKRSNQIYCRSECCKSATNQKVIDRYHQNKSRLAGAERKCKECNSRLSRYNEKEYCSMCQSAQRDKAKMATLQALGFFSYSEE